jgi:transcriptional regulator with XRE-family HTH domain/vacuolar-type H+-ATPase subunit H
MSCYCLGVTDKGGDAAPEATPQREVTVNMLVAHNMAEFRRAAGLTQRQLGERLGGWSEASVSAAERSWDGKRVREFSADQILAIARVLGIPPVALLLPPANSGTAVDYTITAGPERLRWEDLLREVITNYLGDSEGMKTFRQRLTQLGWSPVMDPVAREVSRVMTDAHDLAAQIVSTARTTAENLERDALERAEALERDALKRYSAAHADPEVTHEAGEVLDRARQEADALLTKAHQRADHIISGAKARADDLERDAQERHRWAMGSLIQSREELERRVDDLRAFEREYRSRLMTYLEGQMRDLEAGARDSGVFPAVGTPPQRGTGKSQEEGQL